MKKKLIITLIFGLLFSFSYAQSVDRYVVASSGNEISNGTNTLNFTIGEPLIENITNGSNTVNEGFWNITGQLTLAVEDFISPNPEIVLFPNPVTDFVTIQFSENTQTNYQIQLFDVLGKHFLSETLSQGEVQKNINLQTLSSGTYVLLITDTNTSNKLSFRIVKK